MNDQGLRFGEICTKSNGYVCRQPEFPRGPCRSRPRAWLELGEIVLETFRYQIFKQTTNPPTPKASAWQALTCLAVAKTKAECPTSNAEDRALKQTFTEGNEGNKELCPVLPSLPWFPSVKQSASGPSRTGMCSRSAITRSSIQYRMAHEQTPNSEAFASRRSMPNVERRIERTANAEISRISPAPQQRKTKSNHERLVPVIDLANGRSDQVGFAFVPVSRLLVGVGQAANRCFIAWPTSNLHANGKPAARKATRNGDGGQTGEV